MQRGGKLAIAIAVVVVFVLIGASYAAERTVGMATNVVSPAEVQNAPAAVGTLAHMNDELRTGAKARLQVSFRDSTELTLGENARVVVDRFVFDPDAGTGQALIKTGVGAFRLATGKISEMQNKKNFCIHAIRYDWYPWDRPLVGAYRWALWGPPAKPKQS